jgi:hypothetical protein
MGLTIHYSLRAKGKETQALELVTALHQAAHDLPFKEVGDLVNLSDRECDFEGRGKADPLRWLLCQAQGSVALKAGKGQSGETYVNFNPDRVLAFTAWPGEGCEESNFGLCHYPGEIISPLYGKLKTGLAGWRWRSFCKTQYASNPGYGGVANFLRCHLAVIALLDKAKELGCLDEISDESNFWVKRDVEALVREVGDWNQMIAAFGGRLKDVVGDGLQIAIAEYPNFEQLESAGQTKLPPEMEKLAHLIKQVGSKR